mgnify:CR=1 FL=1
MEKPFIKHIIQTKSGWISYKYEIKESCWAKISSIFLIKIKNASKIKD